MTVCGWRISPLEHKYNRAISRHHMSRARYFYDDDDDDDDDENGDFSDLPDKNDLQALVSPRIYKLGVGYYNSGHVTSVIISGGEIEATVYDEEDDLEHDIEISLGDDYKIYTDCTCDISEMSGQMCQHAVAVLLHMNEHPNEDTDLYEDVTEDTVSSLIGKTAPEEALAFLTKMIADDSTLLHRFISEHGLSSEYASSKYAGEIGSLYTHAQKEDDGKIRENLDFSDSFEEARRTRRDGKNADAAAKYKVISEVISEKMDLVSDDSGYYADCFIEALEGMVECILREQAPHEKKRDYISYLFESASSAPERRFSRYYRDALETICSTDEDVEFWQTLVHIPEDTDSMAKDDLAELLRMQSYISTRLGEHDQTAKLLAGHYSLYSDICIKYLEALQRLDAAQQDGGKKPRGKKRTKHTADDITSAIEAFSDDTKVLEAAYAALPEGSEERSGILERLYAITGEMDYIIRLRHIMPDWDDQKDAIVEKISAVSPKNAIVLCVKEDMYDTAMDILEFASDMDLVASNKTKLFRRRLERYVACYTKTLVTFAGSKSGKDHYERVKDYLVKLKDMPDCSLQYESVLSEIKSKYSGRKTLIKAITKI